mgnify:CR=1 FL=1
MCTPVNTLVHIGALVKRSRVRDALLLRPEVRLASSAYCGAVRKCASPRGCLSGAVDASVSLLERLVAGDAAVPNDGAGCGECKPVAHGGWLCHQNLGVFGFLKSGKDTVALVFLYSAVNNLDGKVFA